MELKKYIKTIFKPAVAKRAKAMKRAKRERGMSAEMSRRAKIAALEKSLGYVFRDKSILSEALTHPGSVGFERKIKSNQRLEFLGDAVLQAVITDTVFRKFEDEDEGKLTKIRIALTQGSFLTELSRGLGIPKCLILPKGAEDIRESASAAEDAFESVVGAIFLDSDFSTAHATVLSWYKRKLEDLPTLVQSQNPKGAMQEIAAKRGDIVSYALVSQSGPDHKKMFEVEVLVNGKPLARATASSKKSAETKAARAALKDYAAEKSESAE
ncbi:MAG: ribonuclease III [Candidatus Merdousia sp.]|nr:ribonuclease III [Candidatus Merdousia sp.]